MTKQNARGEEQLPDTPGRYSYGSYKKGLWLQVRNADHKSWLFRYSVSGRPREMGLGPVSDSFGLEEAMDEVVRKRKQVRQGMDPLEERDRLAKAEKARQASKQTVEEVSEAYIASRGQGWRNKKHRSQWPNSLKRHVYPVIGPKPIDEIGFDDALAVLRPIWTEIPETARRIRARLAMILDFAKFMGWRGKNIENPFRLTKDLKAVLPEQESPKNKHYPACPWKVIGAFMGDLRAAPGTSARALEFQILTATRSGSVRAARWREIDRSERVWHIPGPNMKGGEPFDVPLSDAAIDVLNTMAPDRAPPDDDLIFSGPRGGQLSDTALTMVARRICARGGKDALRYRDVKSNRVPVPHGFRSSFRDWVGDGTTFPRELAEIALAHKLADEVEAAYRRGDAFERRRMLMAEWGTFCARGDRPLNFRYLPAPPVSVLDHGSSGLGWNVSAEQLGVLVGDAFGHNLPALTALVPPGSADKGQAMVGDAAHLNAAQILQCLLPVLVTALGHDTLPPHLARTQVGHCLFE